MNQGRTIFAQLVDLLPRRAFEGAVRRYHGDHRLRCFSCMDQLLCMVFAQITGRCSLRETVTVLRALGTRRYHCGIRGKVARSTLADANERRDYRIFRDTALAMIAAARLELPIDPRLRQLEHDAYALDTTTIDLCLKLFPWASFRRSKAGVKAHTLLDLRRGIPVFLRVSPAKTHDVWMLDQIVPQPGAFYVMDKAYVDFARLYRLHTAAAFFVTRAKRKLDFGIQKRLDTPTDSNVTSDRLIRLRGSKSRTLYPDTLRLVRYRDPDTGKRLAFLTNHLTLDALTVALLYRMRWQIELFFKWVKQHLRIKAFFGTTPNAVQTQLWVAVIAYVLVVRLKHRHQLTHDLNEVLQVLSVTVLEKTPVLQLFSEALLQPTNPDDHNQLSLFDV
jgi:IS4 transposase